MIVKTKIGVKEITITRAEGLSRLCGITRKYDSWEAARKGMPLFNGTYPEPGQGYDKHDFRVIFEDGETYTGRLDVKQLAAVDNDQDVKQHVRDFIQFYTGKLRPLWMTQAQYEQALEGVNRQEYVDFLEKYDI